MVKLFRDCKFGKRCCSLKCMLHPKNDRHIDDHARGMAKKERNRRKREVAKPQPPRRSIERKANPPSDKIACDTVPSPAPIKKRLNKRAKRRLRSNQVSEPSQPHVDISPPLVQFTKLSVSDNKRDTLPPPVDNKRDTLPPPVDNKRDTLPPPVDNKRDTLPPAVEDKQATLQPAVAVCSMVPCDSFRAKYKPENFEDLLNRVLSNLGFGAGVSDGQYHMFLSESQGSSRKQCLRLDYEESYRGSPPPLAICHSPGVEPSEVENEGNNLSLNMFDFLAKINCGMIFMILVEANVTMSLLVRLYHQRQLHIMLNSIGVDRHSVYQVTQGIRAIVC